jgi:ATP-binding protein involved in chromosome partitioning
MRRFRTYHEIAPDPAADLPGQVGAQLERLARRLASVQAVWLVASGKGGVGKSAVTANVAAALAGRGLRVGALDADLNGPSLARMLGADRGPLQVGDDGVRPADGVAGVRVMSMDLLLDTDDAPVQWREPDAFGTFIWQSTLETGALREFLADVAWGELDVLLVDLPPGTDKLRRAFELVPRPAGVLVVTTPSEASRFVVLRSLRLLRDLGAPRIGLVANMTAHVCRACGHHEPLFDDDGARRLAADAGVETWAEVPFHPALARATDRGRPLALDDPDNPAARALCDLADRLRATLTPAPASP